MAQERSDQELSAEDIQTLQEMAAAYRNDSMGRRDALKLGVAGLTGAAITGGASQALVDPAKAGTNEDGVLGTPQNLLDVYIEDLLDDQDNIVASAENGALTGTDLEYE